MSQHHELEAARAERAATPVCNADHHPEIPRCPGWTLDEEGMVEPCANCGLSKDSVYHLAREFFQANGGRMHAPQDECPGCPGYDVFVVGGAPTPPERLGAFEVARNDSCGVYECDDDAIVSAIALYEGHGYELRSPEQPSVTVMVRLKVECVPMGDVLDAVGQVLDRRVLQDAIDDLLGTFSTARVVDEKGKEP